MPQFPCDSSDLSMSRTQQNYSLQLKNRQCSSVSINPTVSSIPRSRHITRKLIRDMVIPRKEPPGLIALVTPKKLSRLKEESHVISPEENDAIIRRQQEEKDRMRNASQMRKAKMEELDLIRKKNVPLNELEEEAKRQTEYLCEKANEIRQENEDEVKELNELILQSKVQAIRDDQKSEKLMINEQKKRAEIELDEMMERDRLEGIRKEKEKAELRKRVALEAAELLQEQIKGNQENRLLQKELKDREGESMKKYFDKLQEEDIEETRIQKLEQKKFRETLLRDNDDLRKLRELKKLQSKQEDIMISAYQRVKAEQEEAAEAELKEKKRQRELEIAKMREQQERASDLQAEKDALRARRAQEAKEREYRKKEKEAAIRNKLMNEELLKHRTEQLENQNRLIYLRAQEENKAFQAMVEKNKQEEEEEDVRRIAKRLSLLQHSKEIRAQIEESEKKKLDERRDFFFEGFHKKQEEKIRKQKVDALCLKKVNELKNYDMPQRYIAHIQRKTQRKMDK